MLIIRRIGKPVSIFLAFLMFLLAVPYQPAVAAMIGTETFLDSARAQEARDNVNQFLTRGDVQTELVAQGVDPLEAKARIDSLTDAEVILLANHIEELPAGGDVSGVFLGVIGILALIFIIMFAIGAIKIH